MIRPRFSRREKEGLRLAWGTFILKMDKEKLITSYFKHDYNSRNDQKILTLRGKFGNEGYALFFMCLESMAEEKDGYLYSSAIAGLAINFGTTIELLESFLDYCFEIGLFIRTDTHYYSKRMAIHKAFREERAKSGEQGARKRWLSHSSGNQQPLAIREENRIEENRIKEKKNKKRIYTFIQPTITEVENYCLERKNGVDPQKWHSWYTANGWKVGKNSMKDWRAAVRTWESKETTGVGWSEKGGRL